jgi:nucleotide-binding universal stress UspA family protein
MKSVVIVCTDGSELAMHAAAAGLVILEPTDGVVVATAVDAIDESLATDGSGHAGPSMTPDQLETMRAERLAEAEVILTQTVAALGIDNAETRIVEGEPGDALCALATELSARALVMGTRGRGRIKRALLGSVSDHVIRNAPCPVLVVGESVRAAQS